MLNVQWQAVATKRHKCAKEASQKVSLTPISQQLFLRIFWRLLFVAHSRPGAVPGATSSIWGCDGLILIQAAKCAGLISTNRGTTSLHASIAYGQRV